MVMPKGLKARARKTVATPTYTARQNGKVIPLAKKRNYRSKFEARVGATLRGSRAKYEPFRIAYEIPARVAKYLPDFVLPDGTIIEAKGKWDAGDRKKHKLLKAQHPDKRIIVVLMNPNNKLRKGSKTTYAQWADANNIEWCSCGELRERLGLPPP